jgi:hypothetical protein
MYHASKSLRGLQIIKKLQSLIQDEGNITPFPPFPPKNIERMNKYNIIVSEIY